MLLSWGCQARELPREQIVFLQRRVSRVIDGNAIGSQAATGAISAVAGTQAVHAGRDAATAGHDATVTGAGDQPGKEGWWARLRKRGMIVAFATIIGAIAAVGGTIVGVCVWLGWTPVTEPGARPAAGEG
jgi:hypothetical protein